MLVWIQAIIGLWPVITGLIDLFKRTPEDERRDLVRLIQENLVKIHDAIQKAKESGGDTGDIEKIIHGKD